MERVRARSAFAPFRFHPEPLLGSFDQREWNLRAPNKVGTTPAPRNSAESSSGGARKGRNG